MRRQKRTAGRRRRLTLVTSGPGTLTGPSISTAASVKLPTGSSVTITATPSGGASFTGWSGDASGSTNPKTITMDADKTVTANFTPGPAKYTLTVNTANGTVTGDGGISTTGTTSADFDSGTDVNLTATPASGYAFSAWSGDSTSTNASITVNMSRSKTVTANFVFVPTTRTLTVSKAGAGAGEITGAGINTATPDNTQAYTNGTQVTLTATPDSSSTFTSWSGDVDRLAPWRGGPASQGSAAQKVADMDALDYEWYYNYSTGSNLTTSVPFVPMIFNGAAAAGNLSSLNGTSADYLLGFNEPDAVGANHLTPTQALDLWPNLIATGRSLGSPATTTGNSQWRSDFFSGAKDRGYRIDFICAHWYSDGGTAADLRNYLTTLRNNMATAYGVALPVWLTEFDSYNGTLVQNTNFAKAAGPLLLALPWLQRVGWFTNRSIAGGAYANTGLCDSTGALTSVGTAYKNWPSIATTNPATVTMNATKAVTATFAVKVAPPPPPPATLYPTGPFVTSPTLTPHTNSAAIIARIIAQGQFTKLKFGHYRTTADFTHPLYQCSESDPTWTIRSGYGNPWKNPDIEGLVVHAPAYVLPAGGSDGSMALLQPDGTEIDLWLAQKPANGEIRNGFGKLGRWDGDGLQHGTQGGITAAGFQNGLGLIRLDEIQNGRIPHALFFAVNGWHGRVYPGQLGGQHSGEVTDPNAPAMGQLFQLNMSTSAINALSVASWAKTILKAMAEFGMYVGDQSGSVIALQPQSDDESIAVGDPPMWVEWAKSVGLPTSTQNLFDVDKQATVPRTIYTMDWSLGVDWASKLRVLNPPT